MTFLDEESRVVRWPKKRRDKDVCLDVIAAKFVPGRHYSEGEVNEVIGQATLALDHALLRRELIVSGRLSRWRDGSRYWRELPTAGD